MSKEIVDNFESHAESQPSKIVESATRNSTTKQDLPEECLNSKDESSEPVEVPDEISSIPPVSLSQGSSPSEDVEKAEKSLEPSRSASEAPYSSFTLTQKRCIVAVASLGGFISPLTTNIYWPALNTIASDLHVSITAVNLTITTYMIFQAIAPSFIGSFTDNFGRRPAYLVGFAIYIASNIGLALNNNYAGLMVLRCVQSAGSSGMVTLMVAVVADVITSAERGSYIAFTQLSSVLGPSVSPIIGGLISQHLGWHWIFWFLTIFAGFFATLILLFYPETCRQIVGDGSLPPPVWNKTLLSLFMERRRKKDGEQIDAAHEHLAQARAKKRSANPTATLYVLFEKETSVVLLLAGLVYAGIYTVLSSLTTQFYAIYHLDDTILGLLFLPQALGSIASAITNGNLLDRNYRRYARRAGLPLKKTRQDDMTNFPIERVRLEIAMPMLLAAAVAVIIYGWLLEYEVNIAGPIVLLFIMGYTTIAGFNAITVLIVDTHRHAPATAAAASNLIRCLMGAGATAVVNPMLERMGRGWTFTFVGLVELCCIPILLVVMKYGIQWRKKDAEKIKRRNEKQDERQRLKAEKREGRKIFNSIAVENSS